MSRLYYYLLVVAFWTVWSSWLAPSLLHHRLQLLLVYLHLLLLRLLLWLQLLLLLLLLWLRVGLPACVGAPCCSVSRQSHCLCSTRGVGRWVLAAGAQPCFATCGHQHSLGGGKDAEAGVDVGGAGVGFERLWQAPLVKLQAIARKDTGSRSCGCGGVFKAAWPLGGADLASTASVTFRLERHMLVVWCVVALTPQVALVMLFLSVHFEHSQNSGSGCAAVELGMVTTPAVSSAAASPALLSDAPLVSASGRCMALGGRLVLHMGHFFSLRLQSKVQEGHRHMLGGTGGGGAGAVSSGAAAGSVPSAAGGGGGVALVELLGGSWALSSSDKPVMVSVRDVMVVVSSLVLLSVPSAGVDVSSLVLLLVLVSPLPSSAAATAAAVGVAVSSLAGVSSPSPDFSAVLLLLLVSSSPAGMAVPSLAGLSPSSSAPSAAGLSVALLASSPSAAAPPSAALASPVLALSSPVSAAAFASFSAAAAAAASAASFSFAALFFCHSSNSACKQVPPGQQPRLQHSSNTTTDLALLGRLLGLLAPAANELQQLWLAKAAADLL